MEPIEEKKGSHLINLIRIGIELNEKRADAFVGQKDLERSFLLIGKAASVAARGA